MHIKNSKAKTIGFHFMLTDFDRIVDMLLSSCGISKIRPPDILLKLAHWSFGFTFTLLFLVRT